ncbi:hypothetical protein [Pseudoduganella violacea]|uniref:DUF2690 domain-containing protein n=1 Tax=Pseudoduganella violacea TaxID=1715466 RepID=A0A7W5BAE0_9BURK|nr:hypothetical protein [Pseudoduganella violacea]MBB3119469.1 hypothetical protein [Pseudoduganella violacea]
MSKLLFLSCVALAAPLTFAQTGTLSADASANAATRSGLFCNSHSPQQRIPAGTTLTVVRRVTARCGLFFPYTYYQVQYQQAGGKVALVYITERQLQNKLQTLHARRPDTPEPARSAAY